MQDRKGEQRGASADFLCVSVSLSPLQVPDDTTKVQLRLDEIRSKMPKFICLNDDMNKTADPPAATLKALRDFYLSYFPSPCPFELEEGQRNSFRYVEEWRGQQQRDSSVFGRLLAPAASTASSAAAGVDASGANAATGVPRTLLWLCLLVGSLLLVWLLLPLTRCKRWVRSARGHPRSS